MKTEPLKTYSLDEMLDKHIGKFGAPKRESFENELRLDLLGEATDKQENKVPYDYTQQNPKISISGL